MSYHFLERSYFLCYVYQEQTSTKSIRGYLWSIVVQQQAWSCSVLKSYMHCQSVWSFLVEQAQRACQLQDQPVTLDATESSCLSHSANENTKCWVKYSKRRGCDGSVAKMQAWVVPQSFVHVKVGNSQNRLLCLLKCGLFAKCWQFQGISALLRISWMLKQHSWIQMSTKRSMRRRSLASERRLEAFSRTRFESQQEMYGLNLFLLCFVSMSTQMMTKLASSQFVPNYTFHGSSQWKIEVRLNLCTGMLWLT